MSTDQLHLNTNLSADEDFAREVEAIEKAVIRPIVRRKLHVSLFPNDTGKRNQDALDLVADVRMKLLCEIQRTGSINAIQNMSAYAATVTFNACYQHFRSLFPERARLRNKLRYLLTHDSRFALWRGSFDRWLCGRAAWTGRDDHVNPSLIGSGINPETNGNDREALAALLQIYFIESDGPLLFDALVDCVGDTQGLIEATESGVNCSDELSDLAPRIDAVLEATSQLRSLWGLILQLPVHHRIALLLNLRDSNGDNLVAAFTLTGVASMRKIAAALEMTVEDLAEIWNSLPWDDNRIAEHLGLKRQQVINLRQTARAKLTRWKNEMGNI